jgi:hypothetical protein
MTLIRSAPPAAPDNSISVTPTGVASTDGPAMDAAVTSAAVTGRPIYLKPGTFRRTTAWDCRRDGLTITTAGALSTIIEQQTDNIPIILLGRQFQRVGGLKLTYANTQPSTATNANAVELYKAYLGSYEGFHISKCARGIHIAQQDYSLSVADNDGNYGAFSCQFSDIWVENYTLRALNLRAYTRRATGSVFTNIYSVNEPGGNRATVDRAVEVELFDEVVFQQLNVEGVACNSSPVLFNDARNVSVTGAHFERVKPGGWQSGFIDVYGSACRASIEAMTVCFSDMVPAASGGADRLAFFKIGDGVQLRVTGLSQHSNTTTAPSGASSHPTG